MSLLNVQNLTVQFYNKSEIHEAVRNVSFSVEFGEIVGIAGESGSGKSTVMRAVMGLLPDGAEASFERCEIAGGRQKAAMVFQDPMTYLNPSVTVGRQLKETIQVHYRRKAKRMKTDSRDGENRSMRKRLSENELESRALELLDMAGIRKGKERMRQYPFELSGGLRQRVVLAIALACEPELLIADEPTTALDVTVQRQILERLRRISAEMNMAVLLVSHDLGVIAALADRVLVMKDGQIVEAGSAGDIFYAPEIEYTKELLRSAAGKSALVGKMVSDRETLKIEKITKKFRIAAGMFYKKENNAVNNVSIRIYEGETFGLVGESGCGKTTLARIVTGLLEPDSGALHYKGVPFPSLKKGRTKEQTRKIQMVFQDCSASLDPRCTVREILKEPLRIHKTEDPGEWDEQIEDMLVHVGLQKKDADKYPHAFSGGQRQRISIARALMPEPELLVLDEPVSALDVTIQGQILQMLRQIQKEKGISYLFISHDLSVVRRMSSRIGVMFAGGFVETGKTKQVYEDPWHPYTKELLAAELSPEPKMAKKRISSVTEETEEPARKASCPYAPRCGYVMECCRKERPGLYQFGDREVACFLYSEEHTGKRSAGYRMTSQI